MSKQAPVKLSARIVLALGEAMDDLDEGAEGDGPRFAGSLAIPVQNEEGGSVIVPISFDPEDGRHYADVANADVVG